MDVDWVRGNCEQCAAAGVAYVFEQWSGTHEDRPTAAVE